MQGDHIVILSEWDSAYGRALAQTFQTEAEKSQLPEAPKDLERHIHAYRYMRGIDGRLPGDSTKDGAHDDSARIKTRLQPRPSRRLKG